MLEHVPLDIVDRAVEARAGIELTCTKERWSAKRALIVPIVLSFRQQPVGIAGLDHAHFLPTRHRPFVGTPSSQDVEEPVGLPGPQEHS